MIMKQSDGLLDTIAQFAGESESCCRTDDGQWAWNSRSWFCLENRVGGTCAGLTGNN